MNSVKLSPFGGNVSGWLKQLGKTSVLETKLPETLNLKGVKYLSPLEKYVVNLSAKPAKPLPVYNRVNVCHSSVVRGGYCMTPELYPKEYTNAVGEFTPCVKLNELWAAKKGEGTLMLQSVVLKSIDNPKTQGRVMLDACALDGRTAPGAFYYKLGFRHSNPSCNLEAEQWLKSGGKYNDAPFITGQMFLPKENIEHCLTYGLEGKDLKYMQDLIKNYKELGLL